jgi:hypothetical protein
MHRVTELRKARRKSLERVPLVQKSKLVQICSVRRTINFQLFHIFAETNDEYGVSNKKKQKQKN